MIVAVLLLASTLTATPAGAPTVTFRAPAGAGAAVRWNVLARELAIKVKGESFLAFTLLSVAQLRATGSVAASQPLDGAVIAASASALTHLCPGMTGRIRRIRDVELRQARTECGCSQATFDASIDLGVQAAKSLFDSRPGKGAAPAEPLKPHPTGPFVWTTAKGQSPGGFQIQRETPWFPSTTEIDVPPPPPGGSPAFRTALESVRKAVQAATPTQLKTLRYWAGIPSGEMTPGLWNGIADELLSRRAVPEKDSIRAFALMNAAMHDAAIACFTSKYRYELARPTQVDRSIAAPIKVPNFPAYPSAHACFSGAAAGVLSSLFPDETPRLNALADEASQSRVWAGLHYPFDGDAGLALGRRVGEIVLAHPERLADLPH